jgi:hypothetical protein
VSTRVSRTEADISSIFLGLRLRTALILERGYLPFISVTAVTISTYPLYLAILQSLIDTLSVPLDQRIPIRGFFIFFCRLSKPKEFRQKALLLPSTLDKVILPMLPFIPFQRLLLFPAVRIPLLLGTDRS